MNKIVGPNGQPIFDFALIEVRSYKKKGLNPFDENNKPVCLPPQHWWNEGFVGNAAVVTGYGRIEEEFVEGKKTSTLCGKCRIFCCQKNFSSDQLISTFFSKTVAFTKSLPKICESKFQIISTL